MQSNTLKVIILAGGKGERLWPLSRDDKPKQFLQLCSGQSLLATTVQRAQKLTSLDNIYVACTDQYKDLVRQHCKNITIIQEPCARNTAVAVALSCLQISNQYPDSIVMFMPADHLVEPLDQFAWYAQSAIRFAQKNNAIVLLGVKPSYPATGYGYIQAQIAVSNKNSDVTAIKQFKEKPTLKQAQDYIAQGFLWNSGIFISSVGFMLEQISMHAPDVLHYAQNYYSDHVSYESMPAISIDYAVMEKSKQLHVLAVELHWSDVGNLESFLSCLSYDNSSKHVIALQSDNNLVQTSKLVALVGVDNLCVVDTKDVLLIAQRSKVQEVKAVLSELRKKGLTAYL